MELTIQLPKIENICRDDRNKLAQLVINVEFLYKQTKRLNTCTKYDLECLLMQVDDFGRKFANYYTTLHSFSISRANNFRSAMQSIAKYCIQVADFMLDKLLDKANPENTAIQIAIQQLVHPEIPVETKHAEIHRNLIIRVIRLLSHWYFPQGDAESDSDE